MLWSEFPTQQQNFNFLDVSKKPRSLHHLFQETSLESPNWELSSQKYLPPSEPKSVNQHPYFQKIRQGSQDQCDGPIHFALANDYCEAMDDLKEKTRIGFAKERLVEVLTGGSCSAMSFQFADDYLKRKAYLTPQKIINEISPEYEHSKKKYRTIQAVFNTLHRASLTEDFLYDKIDAMLKFYDRSLTDASELFFVESCKSEDDEKNLNMIQSFLDQFPEGVFVVRSIHPQVNDKGEAYGHTTIFIKTPETCYFYDPDEGIYKLTKDYENEGLYVLVKQMMLKILTPFGRIYKIKE